MAADPATIALVSVCVTGAVGVGIPLINAVAQAKADARRYDNDRRSKDVDELRGLLDESAGMTYEFTRKLTTLERRSASGHTGLGEARNHLAEERLRLAMLNGRLVMRLHRDHAVVRSFGSWLKAVDDALDEFDRLYWPTGEPIVGTDEELAARASAYWRKYESFLDAAQNLVASPLERLRQQALS